ncbi:delta-aminolevulinic acid dehydratase [Brevibacillus humidisoli]|uniref:delta-aminolevulinic acid dehydratase n=1 Tax=Brevibacillus humidisoli TaxID=2895522 RepID=UPI001E31D3F6|nr:delta-aminolevulinic acid dehydratase [Brevibacillus humidisoli]UFJ41235.1 delta-aminolevulinic acid dehydratase [Brevibacillus humidisoli]
MSKPAIHVALVCGPNCDMEAQAIRATLEYLGARVITYWIGRPNDFISVLSGEDLYPDTEMIILSFHGDEGKFIMPELGEDVYEHGEPKGDFGPDEIIRYAQLDGKIVFGNGCTLGDPALAKAFLDRGCQIYIGPDDYPDGNEALMFIVRLFYEVIQHNKSVSEAYQIARSMSDELSMYQIYQSLRS